MIGEYRNVIGKLAHPTERKLRAHARKGEKAFTCSLEQHLSTAGNIVYFVLLAMHSDLNSYFKKLNTSNTSLTLKEHYKPKHVLSTLPAHPNFEFFQNFDKSRIALCFSFQKAKTEVKILNSIKFYSTSIEGYFG